MLFSNRAVTSNPIFSHAFNKVNNGLSGLKRAGAKARDSMRLIDNTPGHHGNTWELDERKLSRRAERMQKRGLDPTDSYGFDLKES